MRVQTPCQQEGTGARNATRALKLRRGGEGALAHHKTGSTVDSTLTVTMARRRGATSKPPSSTETEDEPPPAAAETGLDRDRCAVGMPISSPRAQPAANEAMPTCQTMLTFPLNGAPSGGRLRRASRGLAGAILKMSSTRPRSRPVRGNTAIEGPKSKQVLARSQRRRKRVYLRHRMNLAERHRIELLMRYP